MIIDCISCNPKDFVVYGYCGSCGRMCEPPLIDYATTSAIDAEEFRNNWNKKKSDPDHPLFSVIRL